MSDTLPRQVTWVFAGLVVATCGAWWLGSDSALTGSGLGLAATLTILIAFAKIFFIGRDFMELHAAPTILRSTFGIWVGVVAAAAIALVVV